MKKLVVQTGNNYSVQDKEDVTFHNSLPVGTYIVKFNKMSETYYLEKVENFKLPDKIYGDTLKIARRILNTFQSRPLSTGVLLQGVKGSGKTLLGKQISDFGLELEIPTLVINNPYCGDNFNAFIQSLESEAIVLFDEFEKIYDYKDQQKVLTLLDGVFPTRKLFVVTANDSGDVIHYLHNRPGRIYYNLKFDTLDRDFVLEYCHDNLTNQSRIDEVINFTSIFSFFNFDMLASAIEEMNRYDEPLSEVLNYLNIEPEVKSGETYTITAVVDDKPFIIDEDYGGFQLNNFTYYLYLDEFPSNIDDESKNNFKDVALVGERDKDSLEDSEIRVVFEPQSLTNYDRKAQEFIFTHKNQDHLVELRCKRNIVTTWKYDSRMSKFS